MAEFSDTIIERDNEVSLRYMDIMIDNLNQRIELLEEDIQMLLDDDYYATHA